METLVSFALTARFLKPLRFNSSMSLYESGLGWKRFERAGTLHGLLSKGHRRVIGYTYSLGTW